MKKAILTLIIFLTSLGLFASETTNHLKGNFNQVQFTKTIKAGTPELNIPAMLFMKAMQVSLPLSCGLTISFQYTPAPGETSQEMMMDFAVIQGYYNTMYCPPPPPLYEA